MDLFQTYEFRMLLFHVPPVRSMDITVKRDVYAIGKHYE